MLESKIAKRNSDLTGHPKHELQSINSNENSQVDFMNLKTLLVQVIAPACVACTIISFCLVVSIKHCNTKKKKCQIQGRNIYQNESQNTKWISVDWQKGTIEDEEPKYCSGDDTKNAVEI